MNQARGRNALSCVMDVFKPLNSTVLSVRNDKVRACPHQCCVLQESQLPPNSSQTRRYKTAEKPPRQNCTTNKLWAGVIRTNKVGGENLRVLSPKHMSPPDSGAEHFRTETVPGNLNSCVTCFALCKFLLLRWSKGVV